ncbi:MAG: fibronectin type III domain-containing protein [Flavobacteriales bacterium]|nr:fibronectin type III domain-containing protein [Flavobacteriales bacterium]
MSSVNDPSLTVVCEHHHPHDQLQRGDQPGPPCSRSSLRELKARYTTATGSVALAWEARYGARSYNVFKSTSNSPFNWVPTGVTTKAKFNVDGLESGEDYWFAVTATGAAGESSLSKPLIARAAE